MLISLHHALDRRLGLSPQDRRYYESVYGNVRTLVKDLLGHSSVEVTRDIYLNRSRTDLLELLDLEQARTIADTLAGVSPLSWSTRLLPLCHKGSRRSRRIT
jgi:hypothetical protein